MGEIKDYYEENFDYSAQFDEEDMTSAFMRPHGITAEEFQEALDKKDMPEEMKATIKRRLGMEEKPKQDIEKVAWDAFLGVAKRKTNAQLKELLQECSGDTKIPLDARAYMAEAVNRIP